MQISPGVAVELTAPAGYRSLVPLDRTRHRGQGISDPGNYRFASSLHLIYVSAEEFFVAARDYPIAFARDEVSDSFVPVSVTGMRAGQNLFVNEAGSWREDNYIPAYVRCHPFFGVEVRDEVGDGAQRVICVDEEALDSHAKEALLGASGEPTSAWQPIEKLLEEVAVARARTVALSQRLKELELFEAFEAQTHPKAGEPLRLGGLYRVSEERLNRLSGKTIRELMSQGHLSRIYAHLMSLDNFGRLLDLSVSS